MTHEFPQERIVDIGRGDTGDFSRRDVNSTGNKQSLDTRPRSRSPFSRKVGSVKSKRMASLGKVGKVHKVLSLSSLCVTTYKDSHQRERDDAERQASSPSHTPPRESVVSARCKEGSALPDRAVKKEAMTTEISLCTTETFDDSPDLDSDVESPPCSPPRCSSADEDCPPSVALSSIVVSTEGSDPSDDLHPQKCAGEKSPLMGTIGPSESVGNMKDTSENDDDGNANGAVGESVKSPISAKSKKSVPDSPSTTKDSSERTIRAVRSGYGAINVGKASSVCGSFVPVVSPSSTSGSSKLLSPSMVEQKVLSGLADVGETTGSFKVDKENSSTPSDTTAVRAKSSANKENLSTRSVTAVDGAQSSTPLSVTGSLDTRSARASPLSNEKKQESFRLKKLKTEALQELKAKNGKLRKRVSHLRSQLSERDKKTRSSSPAISVHGGNSKSSRKQHSRTSSLTKFLDWHSQKGNDSSPDGRSRSSTDKSVSKLSVRSTPVIGTNVNLGDDNSAARSFATTTDGKDKRKPKEKINDLTTENGELKSSIHSLKKQLRRKERKLEHVVNLSAVHISSLESQLHDADVGVKSLMTKQRADVDSRKDALRALSRTVQKLNARAKEKSEMHARTNTELEELKSNYKKLEEQQSESELTIHKMMIEQKANEAEVRGLQHELTEHMERVDVLEEEREANVEKAKELYDQLNDALQKLAWMQDESLAKTEQIERMEDELFDKNDDIDEARKVIEEKLKRIVDLEVELESVSNELTAAEEAHRADVESLEKKLEEKNEQNSVVASVNGDLDDSSELWAPAASPPGERKFGWRAARFKKRIAKRVSRKIGEDDNAVPVGDAGVRDDSTVTVALQEETITNLRSELVGMTARYKEEKYKNVSEIERLKQENADYEMKVDVLEKEFQKLNSSNLGTIPETSTCAEIEGASAHAEAQEAWQTAKTELEKRITLLQEERTLFQSTIRELNSEMDQLREKSEKGQSELEELRHENAANAMKVEALEKEFLDVNNAGALLRSGDSFDSDDVKESLTPPPEGDAASELRSSEVDGGKSPDSQVDDKQAKIDRLEKSSKLQERTVDTLKAEVLELRAQLKSQAYRNKIQVEGLQNENKEKSMQVEVLERGFQEVNSLKMESRLEGAAGEGCGETDDDGTTSKGIVRLDVSYLKDLKSQLAEKDDLLKEKDDDIIAQRAVALRVEEQLRQEIRELRSEKDELIASPWSRGNTTIDTDEEVFLTEEDLLDMLNDDVSMSSGRSLLSSFDLEPVQEETETSVNARELPRATSWRENRAL